MQRIASLIISVYIALFLYANVFFIKTLTVTKGAGELFWNHLAIFIILLIPVYILINSLIVMPSGRGVMGPLRILVLALALAGLLLAVFYHTIPISPVFDLPDALDRFFATDTTFTLWLIVPLIALFI